MTACRFTPAGPTAQGKINRHKRNYTHVFEQLLLARERCQGIESCTSVSGAGGALLSSGRGGARGNGVVAAPRGLSNATNATKCSAYCLPVFRPARAQRMELHLVGALWTRLYVPQEAQRWVHRRHYLKCGFEDDLGSGSSGQASRSVSEGAALLWRGGVGGTHS